MAGLHNRGYVKRAADGGTAFVPIAAESKFLSLVQRTDWTEVQT